MGKDAVRRMENTQVFRVLPKRDFVMVAQDAPPSMSASGMLAIYADTDEDLQKGTVVAIGADVKNLNVGDRVYFQNDKAMCAPIEWKSRGVIRNGGPLKFLMREVNVLAALEFMSDDADYEGTNDICIGLKPDEVKKRRDVAVEKFEKGVQSRGEQTRVIVPGRVVGQGPWNRK